jgi:hypothetical protein
MTAAGRRACVTLRRLLAGQSAAFTAPRQTPSLTTRARRRATGLKAVVQQRSVATTPYGSSRANRIRDKSSGTHR